MIHENYEIVIGLEVHAQLSTKSKMYCSDNNEFGVAPNTNISPITLGHPGTLPKVNEKAIEYAIKVGLAVEGEVRRDNGFARKNYFYADLPKGYQITQDTTPIINGGHVDIKVDDKVKRIGITRIHLEEDAGKSMHDVDPYNTLIDLNRAGTPLIEIVSEPDMRSPEEAYAYLSEIRKLVRHLEVCDGNMEEGSLRCDANISVMPKGSKVFGNRCEVKNMNSLRNVMKAIEYEAKRQIEIVEAGGTIDQETRSFNAGDSTTFTLRSKENANDYRYFPEPDLPMVVVDEQMVNDIREKMPSLPKELFAKYTNELGLSEYDAGVLSDDKHIANYFESIIEHTKDYKAAANWVMGPVKSYLNEKAIEIAEFPIAAETISDIIALIEDGKVNFASASQKLFPVLLEQPKKDVTKLAEELNIIQNSDEGAIEAIVDAVLADNEAKVAEFKSGKKGLLGMFMGQVMKRSQGKADPKLANKLLSEKLN